MQKPSLVLPLGPPPETPVQQIGGLLSRGLFAQGLQAAKDGLARDSENADLCQLAGICAVNLGLQAQAEQLWRRAIALAPYAAGVHANLAVLLEQLQRHDEAEQCYRRAVGLAPENPGIHFNLGIFLSHRQRVDEAEQCYRQALTLEPANPRIHASLGVLLASHQRDEEAETCYRQALVLEPEDAGTHANLGVLLASRLRNEEAEQCYRHALTLDPANAGTHSNLGLLLVAQKRPVEAERHYRQALTLDPANGKAHTNLGLLLEYREQDDLAERHHRQALCLNPASSETRFNLANLLAKQQREAEAEQLYRQAISLKPSSAIAYSNLGTMLMNCQRFDEAELCFRKAMKLQPDYLQARHNLALLLLSLGRFSEGWGYYEARSNIHASIPELTCPQWQGESLAGKSLLVWPEQGLGDMLQFARYLPFLKDQGAAYITLVCHPALKTLMTTLAGIDRVFAIGDMGLARAHDYWTLPLSFPLHCKTEMETIPAHLPYLHAQPQRLAAWLPYLPHLPPLGFRVGLVWKGNPLHENDRHRSLPGLATLAPLWSVPGVAFISLQKGADEDVAQQPGPTQPLLHLGSAVADLADSAAVIAQLDLLICVDTAVAHLAGALGKTCWVLLPAYKTDWRWMQTRHDTPWYPGALRLFRQQHGEKGDWRALVAEVTHALMEKVADAAQIADPTLRSAKQKICQQEETRR